MNIDVPSEPPVSRTIEAKRKALAQFVRHLFVDGYLLMEELMSIIGSRSCSCDRKLIIE